MAVPHCINAALMKLRKKQRLWNVSLDESTETEEPSARIEVEDQGPNPEQLYAQKERQRILSEAMNELTPGMRKAIELRELDERSTERPLDHGNFRRRVKARVFSWAKEIAREIESLCRISVDVRKGCFTKRSATRDISPKNRSPAMCVVRSATKGDLHDGAFVCRSIGDFGIPVFHRPGWPCRPKAASLTRGSEAQGFARSNANSACEGKDSNMKLKDKTTETLELHANTSSLTQTVFLKTARQITTKIRSRAYEIYLEARQPPRSRA